MSNIKNRTETDGDKKHRDRIVVEEMVTYELRASSAVLSVSVKGTSFFADDAAMKKAKEVATLIDALKEVGIPEAEIRLRNVVAESQSGIISKSSSAKYQLSVKCADLERLSETLAIITSAKNCELHKLDWRFSDDREVKLKQLEQVFSAARETGECIAKSLGVQIEGVQDCIFEEYIICDDHYAPTQSVGMVKKMSTASASDFEEAPLFSRMRAAGPVPLPSGQWQKQGIKARVIFHVSKNGSSENNQE